MGMTTVRIERSTRERLRLLEEKLGCTTAETLELAVRALHRQLSWDEVEAFYTEQAGLDDAGLDALR